MTTSIPLMRVWSAFFCLVCIPLGLLADSQEALMERFQERSETVDQLRESGLVGENNRGLLEARGSLNEEQEKVVQAENRDRRAFYTIIGERRSLSVEQVGRVRARSIAERSRPGVWLQNAEGEWYQKE